MVYLLGDTSCKLLLALTVFEWTFSINHLVDHNSKRPHISLRTIQMVDISLRRHIERRTDFNVFEKIRINCRKTKINYFRHAFFNHDI